MRCDCSTDRFQTITSPKGDFGKMNYILDADLKYIANMEGVGVIKSKTSKLC